MPRVELQWDDEQKTWYIPEGVDGAGFAQWLPTPPSPNIRATDWFVAGRKNIAEILKSLT
ncbi:MAG TPA: DUF5710 domain-containing protein [Steroidobacteraceae bacterium]